MFDIGWSELLVIGVVALIVIGPKDLPKALKTAGMLLRKARQISGEFRASLDEMVREAELEEVRAQVKKATEIDIEKEFERLKGLGMTFSQPGPIDVGHVKSIYGRDPEGNLIELQQTAAHCDFRMDKLPPVPA